MNFWGKLITLYEKYKRFIRLYYSLLFLRLKIVYTSNDVSQGPQLVASEVQYGHGEGDVSAADAQVPGHGDEVPVGGRQQPPL